MTENHNFWEGPSFKGLTLLGFWSESAVISEAKKKVEYSARRIRTM